MHPIPSRILLTAAMVALAGVPVSTVAAAEDRFLDGGAPYVQAGHQHKYPVIVTAEARLLRALSALQQPSRTPHPAHDQPAAQACLDALRELHLAVAYGDSQHYTWPKPNVLAQVESNIENLAPAVPRGASDPVAEACLRETIVLLAHTRRADFDGHLAKAVQHAKQGLAILTR